VPARPAGKNAVRGEQSEQQGSSEGNLYMGRGKEKTLLFVRLPVSPIHPFDRSNIQMKVDTITRICN
jgi:hypothetical protein